MIKLQVSNYKKSHILFLLLFIVLILFYFSLPRILFTSPNSKVLLDSEGNIIGVKIAADEQWRMPLQSEIADKYKEAVIQFEDEYYPYHFGVNPVSLFRAFGQYISKGRIVSGGSTISMQVIRLSRGNKPRTVFEKLKEILLAIRLECTYSKDEILSLYASNAPFGGNIVGLEAASWKYFRRSPNDLSWSEAALLAVLPNSPSLIFPGRNTDLLLSKRNRLLDKLKQNNIIDSLACALSKEESITVGRYSFPSICPHLLERAAREQSSDYIQTSIDSRLQLKVSELLNKHSKEQQANGINNMAAIVIDVETGTILSYVGNSDKIAEEDNGNMVDLICAQRSSGSIIKPMLYALLQDKGYILPNTLIPDIPTKFGSYSPKNFSLSYDGAVPAGEALARSLNIPSVKMLQMMSVDQFYEALPRFGISTVNKGASHYGLSIILGGAEVCLEEVTSAYAGMARTINSYSKNDGSYYKEDFGKASYLKELKASEKTLIKSHNAVSAGASYLSLDALLKVKRPEEETGWESFLSANKIAWKTGTSFGFRDAWAVGTTARYVVGVWAGNADGEGRPGLLGVKAAAPLLFDIFSYLPQVAWFVEPSDEMEEVEVCTHSGYRASLTCAEKDTIRVMREGLKIKACPFCKIIHLDKTGTYRVDSRTEDVTQMRHESYFILPTIMDWYYRRNHPYSKKLPAYRDNCVSNDEAVMDIVYPDLHTAIFIPKGMGGERSGVIFEAAHSIGNTSIHWHIDDEYMGTTNGDNKLEICPSQGKHKLTLIDEYGNTISRSFEVK